MSDYRFLPLRPVPIEPDAERRYKSWIGGLDEELSDPETDRSEFCQRVLTELYFPHLKDRDRGELSLPEQVLMDQMDPRCVTLEPEYYWEIDVERYAPIKPLIWLWEMFDKTPMGENIHLGVQFRRILAKRIFARCGKNFKAFQFVKLTFGYGLEVGDGVVVHRHVLLDDRGGIEIGNGASISDFVNVYSHSHDITEGRDVRTPKTIIGDRVRVAYHSTILAGIHLAPNSMIGAGALVTRSTEPDIVYVGVPARAAKKKPPRERPAPTPDPLAGS